MEKLKFLEKYFDLELWKKMQESFSSAIELPVITIDGHGNELINSGAVPYYWQLVNLKQQGKDLVAFTRIEKYNMLLDRENDGKYIIYSDASGLVSIIVPILLNGKIISSVVASCIVQNVRNFEACRALEKLTGVTFEEYSDALNKIKVRNVVEVQTLAKMLALFASLVPELAAQKYIADRKINELTILNQIASTVNSTLDLPKILQAVMNFMLQAIKAKSCSIAIIETKKRYSLHEPSNALLKAESMLDSQVAETKAVIKIPVIKNDFRFYELNVEYNAVLAFPLKLKDEVIGVINLYGEYINLSESDLAFLNIVTTQVAIAIDNARKYENVKDASIRDKLTGLFNRRHFMETLVNEIERSQRFKTPITISMFDIDHFKKYNDIHGHLAGDRLLKELADVVQSSVRNIDTVGRYGGEEFIIIMPATKPQEAKVVIERVRQNIANKKFDGEQMQPSKKITISIGLITCMNGSLTCEEMISHADRNLYKVKDSGRDSVKSTIILDRNMQPIEVFE
ncbi:diguanylate cyclase [Candidatus Woesearchaeota archaeon]|nr:diguanylate cyclase [Candidatus Woesearchaeota archaeon]